MAKARAVLKRLKAVRNIRKITRTMELIATARFKKAMDRATEAAAYTSKIAELASDLAQSATDFSHPLMESREERKSGVLLVLTSNRGLCGGYNSGVLKLAQQNMREAREQSRKLIVEVSGKRGLNFMRFQKIKPDQSYTNFEDKPRFEEVDAIASRYISLYVERQIDWVDVAYVKFLSASKQTAVVETLLPLARPAVEAVGAKPATQKPAPTIQYEFLPSAKEILEEILPAAFKARLFKCFLDAAVSEQIFRMVAMKGATENAGDMINNLSRVYNRARQAQITSELSEIIGGAEALK
ncbi:MAG TPA: ATP synthase F1 subunit gamma [Planctomycetaceae bacterium]|nr:ATP synthase F1 subunit gamma [Planctomycetaceae bacterium]